MLTIKVSGQYVPRKAVNSGTRPRLLFQPSAPRLDGLTYWTFINSLNKQFEATITLTLYHILEMNWLARQIQPLILIIHLRDILSLKEFYLIHT